MTLSLNPRRCGTVVAIDGRENWLIHNHLNKEDETFESVDRDCLDPRHPRRRPRFRIRDPQQGGLGRPPPRRRPLSQGPRLHLRRRRASVDALCRLRHECRHRGCHQPRMAARRLSARAGPASASSMPTRPSACRSPSRCRASPWTWRGKVLSQRRDVPDDIEQPGPEGDAVRQQVGRAAYDLNVQQYCCAGLNFGYFYDRSPIIAYDGAAQPRLHHGGFHAVLDAGLPASASLSSQTAGRSMTRSGRATRCCATISMSTIAAPR